MFELKTQDQNPLGFYEQAMARCLAQGRWQGVGISAAVLAVILAIAVAVGMVRFQKPDASAADPIASPNPLILPPAEPQSGIGEAYFHEYKPEESAPPPSPKP